MRVCVCMIGKFIRSFVLKKCLKRIENIVISPKISPAASFLLPNSFLPRDSDPPASDRRRLAIENMVYGRPNHDLVCYSPKRNFPKTQLKMSARRYTLKEIHIISSQNLTTNRAEGSLKTKIDPFWKDRSTRYCFEPLFEIKKIKIIYRCNFALNPLFKNMKIVKKRKINKTVEQCRFVLFRLIGGLFSKISKKRTIAFLL